ncbi:MAG: hypothetical protein ACYC6T_16610 [Thermoleophilia bacterium]
MFARVSRFEIANDRIDKDIDQTREVLSQAVGRLAGARGLYYLVDRENGITMAVTLWEDAEAMRTSEEEATRIRGEAAEAEGGKVLSVERFEVALQPSDVMPGK